MRVSTQLLVVVGLGVLVIVIGAFEAGKLEREPEIIRWARVQSQTPEWSGGSIQARRSENSEEVRNGPDDRLTRLFEKLSRAITSWTEDQRELSGDALPYQDLDSVVQERTPQLLLPKGLSALGGQTGE